MQPSRYRKLYAGDKVSELLADFYPDNTVEVNGESFYRGHLARIARTLELKSDEFHQVDAYIQREPENEFDENAIAVYIHDQKVGYINKAEAPIFQPILQKHSCGLWVLAAVKHVSDIDQYRVRLMIEKTSPSLDIRAFPFLDLSYLPVKKVYRQSDLARTLNQELAWREEYLAPSRTIKVAGASTAYLVLISDEEGEAFVRLMSLGRNLVEYKASQEPALYDAILEVNQYAWGALSFYDDGQADYFDMFFTKNEGFPKISGFYPGANWEAER